jgi:hypothetical protein
MAILVSAKASVLLTAVALTPEVGLVSGHIGFKAVLFQFNLARSGHTATTRRRQMPIIASTADSSNEVK